MKTTKFLVAMGLSIFCSTGLMAKNTGLIKIKTSSFQILKSDQTKSAAFKVYGNCGMCKMAIEGSLKNVKGIEKADWNKETKMIEVTYNPKVISLKEIKKKIASVGYDTDEFKASDKSYNALPGCCQYERPADSGVDNHDGHNHKH